MNWNKLKQQLESFLTPSLVDRITYQSSGYRYSPDKKQQCYLSIDKIDIFKMKDESTGILWFENEQSIKNDPGFICQVSSDDIEKVRKKSNGKIPEARLEIIARDHLEKEAIKSIFKAQQELIKTDFRVTAQAYLSEAIEDSLMSDDIILNVLALIDRRVGKKRLVAMRSVMLMKHPVVRYFYNLRLK